MRTIEFFRRCPSTRPAKGRPSVYTALCARIEVRPLRARLENQPKITPRGLPERAVRRIVDFFAPGGDSASILVVSRRLRAPPGTLFASLARPWGAFGRSRAVLWALLGRAGDAPRRSWVPPGWPGELREVPGAIFGSILGVPWNPPGPILTRFWLCPRVLEGSWSTASVETALPESSRKK